MVEGVAKSRRFLRRRAAAAGEFARGAETLSGPPISLTVETTTRCPLSCPMCLRRYDTLPAMDMAPEVFLRIWADGDDVCELLILYGLGEPLCDPQIWQRIREAHDRGIAVQLSTNAVPLDGKTAALLLEARPEFLILSVDAADAELYERQRQGAGFREMYANVTGFLQENRRAGTPIFTVVQMVETDMNRRHRQAFRRFWKPWGPGAIRFKRDEVQGRRERRAGAARRRRCPVLWQGPMFLRADGSVLPCCHMIGQPALGRIQESGIRSLWNHPRMQELRRLHAVRGAESVKACRRCHLPLFPAALVLPAFFAHVSLWRRVLPLAERVLSLPVFRGET